MTAIEELTDEQKLNLIEQLEDSIASRLPKNWVPSAAHLEFLAEREKLEQSGAMPVLELDELERIVLDARL
ncbi:MAG: hypothetical protein JWO94_451 [Verrucomicrobiaceae bacterium]|nr:hypothetical protein [Verrucomicrobiaceae bacterium]